MILAHSRNSQLTQPLAHVFFQDAGQTVGFSPMELWGNMGPLAKAVVIVLFIMSIWSLAVIIDRALYFTAARKQSREFAPKVAGALKEGRLDEAIKVADRSKKSHLAEVVTAGLQEFRSFGSGGAITEEQVESSQARPRALGSHRPRQAEARPGRSGHHRFHGARLSACSARWSVF